MGFPINFGKPFFLDFAILVKMASKGKSGQLGKTDSIFGL